jgi:hypothetical protein
MKSLNTFILAGGTVLGLAASAAPVDWSQLPPAATKTGVTFTNDILPLFKESCVRCHGAERPRAQLLLDTLDGIMKGIKSGPIVKTGDSANSLLVKAISQLDPESAMPPKPRARRGGPGGPQGTNAPAMPPREGGPGGGPGGGPDGGAPPPMGGPGPGGQRNFGPPAKPLTAEQVGLVRAWIDQGAN